MIMLQLIGVIVTAVALISDTAGEPGQAGRVADQPATAPGNPRARERKAGYKLETGAFAVGDLANVTLHDARRDKNISVRIRFPKVTAAARPPSDTKTSLPMVVFSHGLGGSQTAFAELSSHWASHGYVTVHPTHDDNVRKRRERGETTRLDGGPLMSAEERLSRIDDVKFIIDAIPQIQKVVGDQGGESITIDAARVGVAGHSAGAYTSQIIGGMQHRAGALGGAVLPDKATPDPRVKCAIIISGQGLSRGLTEDSWSKVSIPWLVITGSEDVSGVSNETPESRRHPFEYARGVQGGGPACYLLWCEGATHNSYQSRARAASNTHRIDGAADRALERGRLRDMLRAAADAPTQEMILDCVSSTTLAFLDGYLKGEPTGIKHLSSPEAIDRLSAGKAQLKSK